MRFIYLLRRILGAGSLYVTSHYRITIYHASVMDTVTVVEKRESVTRSGVGSFGKYKALFTNMPLVYMKHRLIYNAKGDVVDYQVEEVNPMFEECFAKVEKVVGKKVVNYGEVDITSSSCCTKKCLSRKSHLPLNIITVQHRNTMK